MKKKKVTKQEGTFSKEICKIVISENCFLSSFEHFLGRKKSRLSQSTITKSHRLNLAIRHGS